MSQPYLSFPHSAHSAGLVDFESPAFRRFARRLDRKLVRLVKRWEAYTTSASLRDRRGRLR